MNNRSLFRRVLLSLIFLASFSFCSCFGLIELPKKFSYPSPVARTQSSQNNIVAKTDVKPVAQSMTSQDGDGKEVTLVVSGSAPTEKEATLIALRSAIEQTFGTFVSANTEMLNDDIIKDEIVSVSKGNIKNYEKLSSTILPNGQTSVSLKTTVSISRLISYAKSKGSSAEFAGHTVAMNMKIRKMEKENEYKTLLMLEKQMWLIAKKGIYDYTVRIGDPRISGNKYVVPISIDCVLNNNGIELRDCIYNTLYAVSIPESEVESYKKAGFPIYYIGNNNQYRLRNDLNYQKLFSYNKSKFALYDYWNLIQELSFYSFHLSDNQGNSISPKMRGIGYYEDYFDFAEPIEIMDLSEIGKKYLFYINKNRRFESFEIHNPYTNITNTHPTCIKTLDFVVYYSEEELSNLKKIDVSFDQSLMNSFFDRLVNDGVLK